MNLGRNQLLNWINMMMQSQYPSIQSLCDGVAYCQILQAIHPGCINANRITFITKLPLECLRNMKLIEDAFKKLKITLTVSVQKMANARFQDHIIFLQWLYNHAKKYGKQNFENYSAYERRLQILEKQGKNWDEVNPHLIPNQAYFNYGQSNNFDQEAEVQGKIEQINDYVMSLEGQLKEKMQLNWRMMHLVGRSIEQRNSLYSLLQQIEKIAQDSEDNPVKRQLLNILYETPSDFK